MKPVQLKNTELCKLKPFAQHPYKVRDDEEMEALTESIRINGIMTPLLVRPIDGSPGEYEVISGHRRMHAAKKAGLKTVPAFVAEMDRAESIIKMVDSNLQREHLLPSEKAFAYRLKLEALKQQGQRTDLTSRQVVGKSESADQVSETESGRQVQRYIRLTYLLPELLSRVDEGKIALTPAVYLSYLSKQEQLWLIEAMEANDCTPSVSQAFQMKAESAAGKLTQDSIPALMCKEKANQKERLKIPMERIRKYFPASYTNAQMEEEIVKMCEARYGYMSEHDEAEHLGKISSVVLTEHLDVVDTGIPAKPKSVNPAKYLRLQNETAYTRVIPCFGLCSNAQCSPQYEKCVKCDHFRPDELYLDYFIEARGIVQKRLLKFMKSGGALAAIEFEKNQLETINAYIERMSAEESETAADLISFGEDESRRAYGTA